MKFDITIFIAVLSLLVILVPYVNVIIQHLKSQKMKYVQDWANRITRSLEETNLSGEAKKNLAANKLGVIINNVPFFKLSPDQLDDVIDSAVAGLREAGIKVPLIKDTPED